MESAVSHQEVVTGRVTDGSTGDILPGVNVVIKGTLDGAATDSEGEFQLIVPSLQDTLIVTYIGYQQLEVPISGQERLERSEEHTSELQSRGHLVCRLLLD